MEGFAEWITGPSKQRAMPCIANLHSIQPFCLNKQAAKSLISHKEF